MGWLDPIPRYPGVYIGGLHALYQHQALFRAEKITHILSVMDHEIYGADGEKFPQYASRTMQIRVEDDPNEDLLRDFERTSAFIRRALEGGGRVFVHCAMGKSRSATVVCAFLMKRFGLRPEEALMWVCEGRPVCEPNPGFWEQLRVWRRMLDCDSDETRQKVYDEWERSRFKGTAWEWEGRRKEIEKAKGDVSSLKAWKL
jgi:dual specificity phosphatase 12